VSFAVTLGVVREAGETKSIYIPRFYDAPEARKSKILNSK
jgi:hypothetical protein